MFQGYVVVFKVIGDVAMYVCGGPDENELLLNTVLITLQDAVKTVLRGQLTYAAVMDNLDVVLIVLDELIDNGCVSGRVAREQGGDAGAPEADAVLCVL